VAQQAAAPAPVGLPGLGLQAVALRAAVKLVAAGQEGLRSEAAGPGEPLAGSVVDFAAADSAAQASDCWEWESMSGPGPAQQ